MTSIIFAVIVGAIIGAVAHLVMPGRQKIGIIMTVLLGTVGGLIGSAVANQLGYHNANGGVAWIPFFIGVAAAVVLIAIYESVTGRRGGTSLFGRRGGVLGRRGGVSLTGRRSRTRFFG